MKHLTDQYYGGNRLKELAAPVEGGDAANKEYVDAALKQSGVHVYRSLTGTAAKTTSPYWCARWDVADPKVTEYFDGMLVCVKVPVAGNGSYGTALQINDLGYKPIVWNLNLTITTRYPVGSVVWAVYNATQTATLYLGNGSQAITGCWQVMDYNSDTTTVTNVRRYYGARLKPTTDLLDYVLVFRKNETHVVPMHSTPNGTSGAAAYTGSTRTDKEMTTESFDPFGEILFYRNGSKVAANAVIPTATLYQQNYLISVESTFNCGRTLTGNKELYLVVDLQSDGKVKLATDVNPWSQTLPTTNDGHLYICLGVMYNTYQIDFSMHHPIYYHDGTQLRMYTGAKIPTKTSELDNDSGFIAGPSASVEDNIPAFGNTSGNLAKDSGVSVRRLWEDVDVLSEMEVNPYYITVGTGLWAGSATTYHRVISVKDIRKVTITAKTSRSARYAFLRTYTAPSGTDIDTAPDYVSGYTTAKEVPAGETKSVVVPADANYLYIQQSTANYNNLPDYVKFTGIGITEHTGDGSGFVKDDGSVDNSEYLTSNDVSAVALSGDYDDLENTPTIPTVPTHRTINHEQITDSSLGDINLHDGFYFPNAVQDYDGNWYGGVVIGDQVWLAENLRTTHYADGTPITKIPNNDSVSYLTTPYYYEIDNVDEKIYGYLYNWPAVMHNASSSNTNPSGVQGIAPTGWHVPSVAEFLQLSEYLSKQSRFTIEDTSNIAKSLATDLTGIWDQSSVDYTPGNNVAENNSTGMNMIPAGRLFNGYGYKNQIAYFWSSFSDNDNANNANHAAVTFENSRLNFYSHHKAHGLSVRCVCDLSPIQFRNWYIKQYGSLQHHLPQEIPEQIQANWDETSSSSPSYILNKPTIPSKTSDLTNDSGFITVNDVPKEVFVCNYTSSTSTMNKTPTAIVDAKNANKVVMCVMGNAMFNCVYASTLWILFTNVNKKSTGSASDIQLEYIQWTSSSNAWSNGVINLQKKLIDNGAGQNLKTINGNSVLGSGDLTIGVGDVNVQSDWKQTNSAADDFIKNKPTIPADKLFRCQFANENGIGLLNGVTPNDIYEANSLGKTVVCQLIFGNFDVITTLTSITEGLTFVGITEDLNGQTICYKLKYDTTEQEWAVTTINISSFLTAGDISTIRYANATTSNGDIIVTEAITYPLRVNDVLYLVKFIDALPTTYSGSMHFHMNNPVDYPDVAYQGSYLKYGTDIIKQGDTCMFSFRNGVMTLLYNSRWGKMLSDSVTIYSGSSAPSSSIGRDGDIYIMTTT